MPDHKMYRSLVVGVSCLELCARADIFLAVFVLARQLYVPTERHLLMAKLVAKYISTTIHNTIFYPKSGIFFLSLVAFVDTNYEGRNDCRRSTTVISMKVNINIVLWKSKRKYIIPLSPAEAEYVALPACAKQLVALRRLVFGNCRKQTHFRRPKIVTYQHIH